MFTLSRWMATASASSTAAANGPLLPNAEIPHPAERAAGEQGLFRYAQEALLPRKSPLNVPSAGNLLLRPSGLLLLRPGHGPFLMRGFQARDRDAGLPPVSQPLAAWHSSSHTWPRRRRSA